MENKGRKFRKWKMEKRQIEDRFYEVENEGH